MKEIEDPELATKRTRELYKAKGYSDDWIEKRMCGIAIREELTDEWSKRGAKEAKDYAILSAEISKSGKLIVFLIKWTLISYPTASKQLEDL